MKARREKFEIDLAEHLKSYRGLPAAARKAAEAAPWFDAEALAEFAAAVWGVAAALEYTRLAPQIPEDAAPAFSEHWTGAAFKESVPWADALESFLSKRIINARDMEEILTSIDDALDAGYIPEFFPVQQAAYKQTFTMVREANQAIIERVDALVAKAISTGMGPGDFVQDMDDLYRSLGLREQSGWYNMLVYDNALYKACQEGRDSISHDYDSAGRMKPKSWVWGYLWQHGGSSHPRPTHLAMNGHQAPVDDPIWQTFTEPPIAHNCSCARHVIGKTRAEETGLTKEKTFPAPTVGALDLKSAGIEDLKRYAGRPVDELAREIPGERFPRSDFGIKDRPLINPSEIDLKE